MYVNKIYVNHEIVEYNRLKVLPVLVNVTLRPTLSVQDVVVVVSTTKRRLVPVVVTQLLRPENVYNKYNYFYKYFIIYFFYNDPIFLKNINDK